MQACTRTAGRIVHPPIVVCVKMMMNTSDFMECRIDDRKKLLYCRWLRDVEQDEYRTGLMQVYQLIKENALELWLQDSSVLTPRSVPNLKWLTEEFGILLVQSTLKFCAVVTPSALPHHAGLASIRDKAYRIYGKTKLIQVFDTTDEALAWLLPNLQHYRLPDIPLVNV
ncbi:hypothetical protein H7F15_06425 [Pontibacter sp. Tf4]|uniref:hypothetical protein n=1 Tax=Pontibacter sp. Tf4 TaxID=2761620 RepID=UPI00162455A4|nr:hypothetical protein [Pontibacter sp. Tf4]MBB6610665.1 hypothetical protein [Pontibacter sp. Tf4]